MHRLGWRELAVRARQRLAIVVQSPIAIIMDRLMSLALILLGYFLVMKGGNEAHLFNGLVLNTNWKESTPEAKLIFGSLAIGSALTYARVTRGRWRRMRAAARGETSRR